MTEQKQIEEIKQILIKTCKRCLYRKCSTNK